MMLNEQCSECPYLRITVHDIRRITMISGEEANITLSIDTNTGVVNYVVIYIELEIAALYYDCNEVSLIETSVKR